MVGRTAFMVAAERALEAEREEGREFLAYFTKFTGFVKLLHIDLISRNFTCRMPSSKILMLKLSRGKMGSRCRIAWERLAGNSASRTGLSSTRQGLWKSSSRAFMWP